MASQDMTFCTNDKCTRKKCERHPNNINWLVGPPWRSFADFDGTKYCCKEVNKGDNNKHS